MLQCHFIKNVCQESTVLREGHSHVSKYPNGSFPVMSPHILFKSLPNTPVPSIMAFDLQLHETSVDFTCASASQACLHTTDFRVNVSSRRVILTNASPFPSSSPKPVIGNYQKLNLKFIDGASTATDNFLVKVIHPFASIGLEKGPKWGRKLLAISQMFLFIIKVGNRKRARLRGSQISLQE